MKRRYSFLLWGIGSLIFLAVFSWHIYLIFSNPLVYQWDFKRYYYAGKLSLLGYSPYDLSMMVSLFGEHLPLKQAFIYPPYTIFIFKYLAKLDMLNAYYLFAIIKICAYLFILSLWKKIFFRDTNACLFLLFISISVFSESVYTDFHAGNVSVFEQVFFWLGMAYFYNRKMMLSVIFMAFSNAFKLLYLPFSLLFMATGALFYFWAFTITFIVSVAVTGYVFPAYSIEFIKNNLYFIEREESGHISVSMRSFFRETLSGGVCNPELMYVLTAVLIFLISFYVVMKNRDLLKSQNHLLIYFFIVAYCLVTPRLKDYGQIILIPPAYFLLDYFLKKKRYLTFAALIGVYFMLNPHYFLFLENGAKSFPPVLFNAFPGRSPANIWSVILNYHILFTVWIIWVVYIAIIHRMGHLIGRQGTDKNQKASFIGNE